MTRDTKRYTVRVYHDYYGCKTGCCGHIVEITDQDGLERTSKFSFDHPFGSTDAELRGWAREMAEDVIASEFPECQDSIDWESMICEVLDD